MICCASRRCGRRSRGCLARPSLVLSRTFSPPVSFADSPLVRGAEPWGMTVAWAVGDSPSSEGAERKEWAQRPVEALIRASVRYLPAAMTSGA